jgi:hypothetical protein
LVGLDNKSVKKFIGLGVWVKVDSPACCAAARSSPVAIPTLSFTQ